MLALLEQVQKHIVELVTVVSMECGSERTVRPQELREKKNHAVHTSEAAKFEVELLGIQQRLVGLKCKETEVAGRSERGVVAPQQQ